MAKLVKQIHDLISLAIDKGYTQYITDAQIDDVIDGAQMEFFRQLLKRYPQDKRVRNDLLPFEVRASITVAAKIGPLPADFEHEIETWVTVGGLNYPVTLLETGFFKRRVLDPIDPPSATNVFASIYYDGGKKIEVAPDTTPILIQYFKRPTKPFYATTGPTNGQFVYDDASSIDVLWSATVHDIIIQKSLSPLGLNIRDGQVQRAGQPTEPKEATV